MWAAALLLCASGSLYPIAVIAVIAYLGNARPMAHALAFLAGGALVMTASGTGLLAAFRLLDLVPDKHPTPSAAVEIGLGIGIVVFAVGWLVQRRRNPAASASADASAATDDGEAPVWRAFVAGMIVYLPMLSYFAAVKIIADQPIGVWAAAAALVPCIVVSLMITWIPIVAVAVAGARSRPALTRMAALIDRYAATVLIVCAAGAGCYLVLKGVQRIG